MRFEIDTQIPYGNACDLALNATSSTLEVSFSPDPHGGPETLWFCFRLRRSESEGPEVSNIRLTLKHSYNILGGQYQEAIRPVIRYEGGIWRRLPQGKIEKLPDGRSLIHWTTEVPNQYLDVAYCYPYGMPQVQSLVDETDGFWQVDTIGVSQGARPLIRLSNDYGEEKVARPGLYVMARQHAGETPGSWVLDGFLRAFAALGPEAPLVWAVPLANIDAIERGDYGKDNFPYDLNRAWGRPPMRHEVSVFQRDLGRWRARCRPVLCIDFHAPGGTEPSGVFAYIPDPETDRGGHEIVKRWAAWTSDALTSRYAADDFARVAQYPSRWETPSFRTYAWFQVGVPCITFETSYALAGDRVLRQEDYRNIGERIAQAVVQGITRSL
ncbi:MAG: hypothetical protein ACP5HS_01045 [Anaerolineae bacterium]